MFTDLLAKVATGRVLLRNELILLSHHLAYIEYQLFLDGVGVFTNLKRRWHELRLR